MTTVEDVTAMRVDSSIVHARVIPAETTSTTFMAQPRNAGVAPLLTWALEGIRWIRGHHAEGSAEVQQLRRIYRLEVCPIIVFTAAGESVRARIGKFLPHGYFLPLPVEPAHFAPLYYKLEEEGRTWTRADL